MFKKMYKINSSIVVIREVNGYDFEMIQKKGSCLTVAETVAVVAKAIKDGLSVAPWEFTSLSIKSEIVVKERRSGAKEIYISSIDEDGYKEPAGHIHVSMAGKFNESLYVKCSYFLQAMERYYPEAIKEAKNIEIKEVKTEKVEKWEYSKDLAELLNEEVGEEIVGE